LAGHDCVLVREALEAAGKMGENDSPEENVRVLVNVTFRSVGSGKVLCLQETGRSERVWGSFEGVHSGATGRINLNDLISSGNICWKHW
jgi:hypothetical protein